MSVKHVFNAEEVFYSRYCVVEKWVLMTRSEIVRVVFDLIKCADEIELYKIAVCVAIKNGDENFKASFPEFAFS